MKIGYIDQSIRYPLRWPCHSAGLFWGVGPPCQDATPLKMGLVKGCSTLGAWLHSISALFRRTF